MKLHPGIRIDKIKVKGGPGLVFAFTILAIVLIGVPQSRLFLICSLAGGLIIAAALRFLRR